MAVPGEWKRSETSRPSRCPTADFSVCLAQEPAVLRLLPAREGSWRTTGQCQLAESGNWAIGVGATSGERREGAGTALRGATSLGRAGCSSRAQSG